MYLKRSILGHPVTGDVLMNKRDMSAVLIALHPKAPFAFAELFANIVTVVDSGNFGQAIPPHLPQQAKLSSTFSTQV